MLQAWEDIVRGIVHWDRTGRAAPLAPVFSLPIVTRPHRGPVDAPASEVWHAARDGRSASEEPRGLLDRLGARIGQVAARWRGTSRGGR